MFDLENQGCNLSERYIGQLAQKSDAGESRMKPCQSCGTKIVGHTIKLEIKRQRAVFIDNITRWLLRVF